jgi:hypothetical protein
MQTYCEVAGKRLNELSCSYCGARECTHRRYVSKAMHSTTYKMAQLKSSGEGPKQASSSSPTCQELKLEFSEDASPQDLYLLIASLCAGGFAVSVSVQATPASAPSPSATPAPSTSSTKVVPSITWLHYLDALGRRSKDTTQ